MKLKIWKTGELVDIEKYYSYDSKTGLFFRKGLGRPLKIFINGGRPIVCFFQLSYAAQYAAWYMHYREPAETFIGFLDGNPMNLEINNLAELTSYKNGKRWVKLEV